MGRTVAAAPSPLREGAHPAGWGGGDAGTPATAEAMATVMAASAAVAVVYFFLAARGGTGPRWRGGKLSLGGEA